MPFTEKRMSSPVFKHIWNVLRVGKRQFHHHRRVPSTCQSCFHTTSPVLICSQFHSDPTVTRNSRSFTTSTVSVSGPSADNIISVDRGIQVTVEGIRLHLPFIWLRDHCHCELCYNQKTYQKNVNWKFDLNVEPKKIDYDGSQMTLTWPDNHTTVYNSKVLLSKANHSKYKSKVPCQLWNSEQIGSNPPPRIGYEDHMNSATALKRSVFNLLKFGFTIVTQVPPTTEDTRQVVEKIAPVRKTLFGEMWSFSSDGLRADTAYTNIALGAHTDMTYYTDPAGIQVFHCLEHDGEGGETLLVDGFNAAKQLQETDPKAFDILRKTVVPHEYLESDYNFHSLGTVLTVHPTTREMFNIRFNPYDRAHLYTVPPDKLSEFYLAYEALAEKIKSEKNELWIKLEPGMVILVNNWRVLHGRAAFTGKRVITGCYLLRDDWLSTARVLQVL